MLEDFYPGDHYVDWIGVSVFRQPYSTTEGGTIMDLEEVFRFATSKEKPTMIAESSPFDGVTTENSWNDWFQEVLDVIERYDVSMWSYINCDWDSQPMWHDVGFGDSRISTNHVVLENWRTNVLRHGSRFLLEGSLADCGSPVAEVVSKELIVGTTLFDSNLHLNSSTISKPALACILLCIFLSSLFFKLRKIPFVGNKCSNIDFACKTNESVRVPKNSEVLHSKYQTF